MNSEIQRPDGSDVRYHRVPPVSPQRLSDRESITVAEAVEIVTQCYRERDFGRNLRPHLTLIERRLGAVRLVDVVPGVWSDLRNDVQEAARRRDGSKHGVGAAENFTAAVAALYRLCGLDAQSQVRAMGRLVRPDSGRKALSADVVGVLFDVAKRLPDPRLALLVLVFSIQSGARISSISSLRVEAIVDAPWVRLVEKGATVRRVPITDALRVGLLRTAVDRGAARPDDALFRTKRGEPVSVKSVQDLMRRWRSLAVEADRLSAVPPLTHHWLRHTAINNIVQASGQVALGALFAGHKKDRAFGVTGTYIHVQPEQLIPVVEQLHGPVGDRGEQWARGFLPPAAARRALGPGPGQ